MTMCNRSFKLHSILFCAAGALLTQSAAAVTLDLPANKTPSAAIAACTSFGGGTNYINCKSQAFVSETVATMASTYMAGTFNGAAPTTQTFKTAFDNWNASQTTGVTWSLVNGGALANVTLKVNPFTAFAAANVGGIDDITVSVTFGAGYNGPTTDQLVWSQGLYINFQPPSTPSLIPPAVTMDTYSFSGNGAGTGAFGVAAQPLPMPPANSNNVLVDIPASPAGKAYADPIYPFQYGDLHFFDAPKGPWLTGSFRGIALLSTVSMTTDAAKKVTAATLTVYDGISYGFDLSGAPVPEPSTWAMLVLGFGLIGAGLRRHSATLRRAGA
jgi:hypothetical protein